MTRNETSSGSATRQRSTPYPRYTLQQAEKFAKVVFTEGPRNCDQNVVAKKAGYSRAKNGSFFAMRSAASQFGFVIAKGDRISVSEEWIEVFHEDTADSLRRARQAAIKQPSLYSQLLDAFLDKQLPEPEKLARTIHLNPKYGIMKDAAVEAVKIFMESAQYAGVLDERHYLRLIAPPVSSERSDNFDNFEDDEQPPLFPDSAPIHVGNRPTPPMAAPQSASQPSIIQSAGDGNTIYLSSSVEKQEFTFRGGKKAYFIAPAPLPIGEKTRLKQWLDLLKLHIDLTLEDDPESQQ